MGASAPSPQGLRKQWTEATGLGLWGQAGAQKEAPLLLLILGSEPGSLGQAEPSDSSRRVQMLTAGESVHGPGSRGKRSGVVGATTEEQRCTGEGGQG